MERQAPLASWPRATQARGESFCRCEAWALCALTSYCQHPWPQLVSCSGARTHQSMWLGLSSCCCQTSHTLPSLFPYQLVSGKPVAPWLCCGQARWQCAQPRKRGPCGPCFVRGSRGLGMAVTEWHARGRREFTALQGTRSALACGPAPTPTPAPISLHPHPTPHHRTTNPFHCRHVDVLLRGKLDKHLRLWLW